MKHYLFGSSDTNEICILTTTINAPQIKNTYIEPFALVPESVLILDLYVPPGKKKASVKEMKQYFKEELVPTLIDRQVKYIICTDAEYFKAISGQSKADSNIGYLFDCPQTASKLVYAPSYKTIFYNPDKVKPMIDLAMAAVLADRRGAYVAPGTGIIKSAYYPKAVADIAAALQKLIDLNVPLTCDIEAFSLKHYTAGIATIAFAWNQQEGIAFAVDYEDLTDQTAPATPFFGTRKTNQLVRNLLIDFFTRFKQKVIYHNIAYDAYVLIYQLFMKDITDTEGLLFGSSILLRDWEDTKLIAYLATNSCAGNALGLKALAQEFAGNYAQEEIKNVLAIPLPKLLEYNLVDALSTWFVYDKYYQTMIQDSQLDLYETLFKPATLDIIQMQLTGMPLNMERVKEVKAEMQVDFSKAEMAINSSPLVQAFTHQLNLDWVTAKNATYKTKRVSIQHAQEKFNSNSGLQLQKLLFEQLNLPVLGLTDNKQPSTDGDTIKALKNHTTDPIVLELLTALIDHKAVDKILNTFIPAMENAIEGPDGWHYLFGNFNLGGTVSGRLSSNNPNLQNLPANSKYGKLIKSAFQAPPGITKVNRENVYAIIQSLKQLL